MAGTVEKSMERSGYAFYLGGKEMLALWKPPEVATSARSQAKEARHG